MSTSTRVKVGPETVSLVDIIPGDLLTAGALPGRLRSNDATQVAVALRVGADEMLGYHDELPAAGLSTQQPRWSPGVMDAQPIGLSLVATPRIGIKAYLLATSCLQSIGEWRNS
jgi:hypothetical protein